MKTISMVEAQEEMIKRFENWPERLKKSGLSVAELSRKVGVDRTVVFKWMNFEKYGKKPSAISFDRVEKVFEDLGA